MDITDKNISAIFKTFVLFAAIYATSAGPWGSDVFGALFGQEIKIIIQYISGTVAAISLVLYFTAKNKFKRTIVKLGNAHYTQAASKFINATNIPPDTVELAIRKGVCIKRKDTLKYTWISPEGIKYIIITSKDGVVSEVAC